MARAPEIMAPAGGWAALQAALGAGADAVYFGVRGFNMRESSRNFTLRDLPRIASLCHARQARAYLTLNTTLYQEELPKVRRTLAAAKSAGIDAVVAWDLAAVQAAADLGLEVFLSTQASVSNSAALLSFHRHFGVRRFVLARECTLGHIRSIRRAIRRELGPAAAEIELEVFAHGAMCVSVSGRCYMSEQTSGRSANRGRCTQPCRRPYEITAADNEAAFRMGENYLLSPQDLCTLPFIEQLLAAGVDSLKIEGRGRSPDYVAAVTGAYRRAVDFHTANRRKPGFGEEFSRLKEELMRELDGVFHRGLSSGFFMGRPIGQWSGVPHNQASVRKLRVGVVDNYYSRAGAAEIRVLENGFQPGDELLILGPTTGSLRHRVESIQIERREVPAAEKGGSVAIRLPSPARRGDQVFLLTEKTMTPKSG